MVINKDLVVKAKQELMSNGIALIKNYMSDSKELLELKRKNDQAQQTLQEL